MSAAKLRKFGRGTAIAASTVLVMTSFGPAAFASWDDAPQTSFVDTTQVGGTIGIVDTEPGDPAVVGEPDAKEDNQGATLVEAGKKDQAIGDIRLTLPNRFASGDLLDLKLLDRSATEHSDGLANQNADTLVGFSGVEGVTIEVSKAMDARTTINADTDAVDTASPQVSGNTETTMLPWAAGTNSDTNPLRKTEPSAAPSFTAPTVAATAGNQGKDNLRLQVNTKSEGDPSAVWVVTIKGLKVDLGAKATPGELRVVPFLSNVGPASGVYTASPWFCGNTKEDNNGTQATNDDTPREIGIYTVPAFVSPVTVSADTTSIVSDGTAQSVGEMTISETQPFSLQNGTYTVDFDESGADVTVETLAKDIKAAIAGGGGGETVSNVTVAADRKSFSFTLAGADNSKASTITLSGVMLKAERSGDIAVNITGGSMSGPNSWLTTAGTSTLAITNPNGADIYPSAAVLNSATGATGGEEDRLINQALTVPASTDPAATTPAAPGITPGARSDVLPGGTYTVSTDGNTITSPDGDFTLTRGTTAGSTTFTGEVPGVGTATDTYAITGIGTGIGSFTLAPPEATSVGATVTVDPPLGDENGLPVGTYVYAGPGGGPPPTAATLTLGTGPDALVLSQTAPGANTWTSSGTNPQMYTLYTGADPATGTIAANLIVVNGAVSAPTAPGAVTVGGVGATDPDNLPEADYTASADGNTITGGGVTLQRVDNSTTFRIASAPGVPGLTTGDQFAFTGIRPNVRFHVDSGGAVDAVYGSTVTVEGAQNLGAGTYVVTPGTDAGTFDIDRAADPNATPAIDALDLNSVRNGTQVDGDADPLNGIQGVTFYGLADGQTFTIAADDLLGLLDDCGVNQADILAPTDEFTKFGSASAGTSAVGGANRFETARKIAKMYSPRGDYAIIASGVNFPDALSSGYLSQRMDAPILLVDEPRLSVPEDTMESLRERGVRKVYIVGGPSAVSDKAEEALKSSQSYMFDQAAGNLRPRGSNLEVQRIGGGDRFGTNALVNMYAAAQFDKDPSIGRTVVGYGQPLKTTAMVARADDFADALTANVLTAGRAGKRAVATEGADSVVSFERNFNQADQAIGNTDLQKFGAAGEYRFTGAAAAGRKLEHGVNGTWTTVATAAADGRTYTGAAGTSLANQTITFSAEPLNGSSFALAMTEAKEGTYGYASDPATRKGNALPVILTDKDGLNPAAEGQIMNLHVEHTLLIGSENAVSASVDSSIKGLKNAADVDLNVSTRRLGGTDRYDTAKIVNEYAMAPQTATAGNTTLPGLGYEGGRLYDSSTDRAVSGEHTVYLANGGVRLDGNREVKDPMRFADALVAGPWISAEREAMALTGVVTTPDPTTAFYNENRDELDRAVGLGLGQAVSTKVIEFANRVVSGSLRGQGSTPAPTATPTATPTASPTN